MSSVLLLELDEYVHLDSEDIYITIEYGIYKGLRLDIISVHTKFVLIARSIYRPTFNSIPFYTYYYMLIFKRSVWLLHTYLWFKIIVLLETQYNSFQNLHEVYDDHNNPSPCHQDARYTILDVIIFRRRVPCGWSINLNMLLSMSCSCSHDI